MFTKYFKDYSKKMKKKSQTTRKSGTKKKTTSKTAGTKKAPAVKINLNQLKENLRKIIPGHLVVDSVKPITSSGFSPEGSDLIIYKEYCTDIVKIMDGYMPYELIYGTVHAISKLNKSSLSGLLNRVISVKKLARFSDELQDTEDSEDIAPTLVPAFIIALESNYSLTDLKNDILNYFMANSIENNFEFDILVIMNKGLILKNWKEKRSFIALETKEDTMMWFFILMNEYLDFQKLEEIDFRKYIQKNIVYDEF